MATAADVCVSPQAEENTRQALYLEVINGFIDEGTRSSLSLVVIGEAGQGKSTLINGLVGKQIAVEGDEFDAGTTGLDRYQFHQNGVRVDIWDTPGFGMADPNEEEKTLWEMARDIKRVDLVLYCMRIDSKRWPKRNDVETIEKITKIFTKKIWCHCLFVLTFANCAAQHLRPEDDQDTPDAVFSRHVMKWENRIRQQVQKLANLSNIEAENIRAVPVGSYISGNNGENPWKLPDREDWFICFWMDITDQMREAALPSLLQLNRHRLAAQLPAVAEPEDCDQDSINPVLVEVEVHDRLIPGTIPTEVENSPDAPCNDRPDTAVDKPQTYTSGHWSRSHTSSVDQNIYDEELTASTSNGDPKKPDEGSKDTPKNGSSDKPRKPDERKLPLRQILTNMLDKENSGFKKYVKEFAKARGEAIPALGHVGGFVEGLLLYLGSNRRKKKYLAQRSAEQTEASQENGS